MGIYIRTSVTVGPFRFNFSKSGISASAGIKGLRVGTGPRGNYVSVGRGSLSYRATVPVTDNARSGTGEDSLMPPQYDIPMPPAGSVGPMIEIASAPPSAMQDSSSAALLAELNGKHRRPSYWIWTAIVSFLFLIVTRDTLPPWGLWSAVTALLALTAYVAVRDEVAKTVVLGYELDSATEEAYQGVLLAFTRIQGCHRIWRITSSGRVNDIKYHAGAGSLVTRVGAAFRHGLPPRVKSNIDVAVATSGKSSLYFMPDRILIYAGGEIGAISYSALELDIGQKRFVEDGSVPSDAQIVDRTWQYVNKKGGPDRRFKNNRQLPVALYEEVLFRSASGLNELFQLSKTDVSGQMKLALKRLAAVVPQ